MAAPKTKPAWPSAKWATENGKVALTGPPLPTPEVTGNASVNARKGNSPSGQGGSPTGPADIVGFMKPQTWGKGPLPMDPPTTPTGATKGDTGTPFRGSGASAGPTRRSQGAVAPKGAPPNMDYTSP